MNIMENPVQIWAALKSGFWIWESGIWYLELEKKFLITEREIFGGEIYDFG